MSTRYAPFVAIRYLRSRRKEAFISFITVISILGVAISVMVLDIVLAIMTGFEAELRDKLLSANSHVAVRRVGGSIENWNDVLNKVAETPGVAAAYPFTYSQAMVSVPGGARGVLIRGIPDNEQARNRLDQYMTPPQTTDVLFEPAFIEITRPDGTADNVQLYPIVVGEALKRKLGLGLTEPLTMYSPQLRSSPQGFIPRQRRFLVSGAYSSGLVEYESGLAYVSLAAAQSFFGLGTSVSGIEVILDDLYQAKAIGKQILDKLADSGSAFYVNDWMDQNRPLWEALQLEKRVYFIVLQLLVLVASFSIVSTLVMVVMEKRKDIAILKSMGASNKFVRKVFLLQGSVIGFLGSVLGTLLGYVGCIGLREYGFEIDQTVFGMDTVPVHLVPMNFAIVFLLALIITALAGIYPAHRASSLKPAEVLRYE